MPKVRRRQWLAAGALAAVAHPAAAHVVRETLPWSANEAYPPEKITPGPWRFFTMDEGAAIEAIAARLIPGDSLGPSGKDAGCATFIDAQLAGPYGVHDGLYMQGPFPEDPLPSQGLQSPVVPRDQYRQGLAALDAHCRQAFQKPFVQLTGEQQDQLLMALEKGEEKLIPAGGKSPFGPVTSARTFFDLVLTNTMEGYFADPIYGGNKDMAGWKLVKFPGTRYDYRDVMENPNKPYTLPPVSVIGRPEWNRRG